MTASSGTSETKKATVNGLAVVGFGALIVGGILLAIYASKYVPDALSRLSSAVYLSGEQEQNPEDETPAGSEDEPGFVLFPSNTDDEEPTDEEEPSTPTPSTPTVSPNPPVYYPPVYYPLQPVTPNLYGRADLVITNVRTGYFRGATFVEEDDELPDNRDAAVKFTVANRGTNVAENWRIRIDVENEDTLTGTGGFLMPDGYQNFTVRIEDPKNDERLSIEIEIDYTDRVDESDERNNDRTLRLEIEG